MRKAVTSFVVLVFCFFCATVAQAGDGSDLQSAVDCVVRESYESRDVRYLGVMLREEPVVKTELALSESHGWHASVLLMSGTQEFSSTKTPSDELDFTVGKTWKSESEKWLTADLLYLSLRPFGKSAGDVLVPRVKFGQDFAMGEWGKIKPYAQLECRLGLPDFVRRPTGTVGVDYALPLVGHFTLKTGVSALYDCGIANLFDTGWTLSGRIGLEAKITEHLSAEVYLKEFAPHQQRDRQHQEVFGVSVTLNF